MLKHLFLWIIVLLLSASQISAQEETNPQRWYLGLYAGTNISDLSTTALDLRFKNQNGLLAGISLRYQLNENFSLKSGIEFDQRRFGMEANYQGLRYVDDTSMHICYSCRYEYEHIINGMYVTVPLVFQYGKNIGRIGFHVKGGLYYSLLLQAYHDGQELEYFDPVEALPFLQFGYEPGLFVNSFNGKAENLLNTNDAGIILGVGGTYALGSRLAFLAEANLQVGFKPLFESPDFIAIYHSAFQFRGGLVYRLNFNSNL
ncbi:MAG: PorT family protein [Bacteroidetes bacterium]|nr:PorT family protein [Bacteroidota bacterium]MBU1579844.1 PorT family protein [Bacteroidota bacterium]MBU2556591.1 PorT family protein [Bacteroidota bacterium]